MNIEEQIAYLMLGAEYGDDGLRQAMQNDLKERLIEAEKEGRPLRVYCGYDPTRPDLHLGHTVSMRKLRQFQELGHEVTFLIGDYTTLIGDPSDHDGLRPTLSPETIAENAKTYTDQAFMILDREKTIVRSNSEWLSQLGLADLIKLGANFTVQQFIARENFKKRWDREDAIYLHETFYSLMQAYDAYYMRADVQVGGSDQLFNIITAGRKLMTALGEKPNIGIILGILPGTDGVIRMSKSLGNHIALLSPPEDKYGKVMSLPDKAMSAYFRLVTRWTPAEIANIEGQISEGKIHPRDAKMKLAREIVSSFHGDESAAEAEAAFVRVFQDRKLPEDMPEYTLQAGQTVLDVLDAGGLISSRGEGRRMLQQNGVRLDGETLTDPSQPFPHPGVLQAGKRRFLRVVED